MKLTRRKIVWTVTLFVVLSLGIVWLYSEGKVTMEDIMTKQFKENKPLFEQVVANVSARPDITGIAGPSYRGEDEQFKKLFQDLDFLTLEKRQEGAVLFVKSKKLGFDHGVLYVPAGATLPPAAYAVRTQIDADWYFVSIKTD